MYNQKRKIYDIFKMLQGTKKEEVGTKLINYLINTYNQTSDEEIKKDLASIIGYDHYAISNNEENDNIITYFKEFLEDEKHSVNKYIVFEKINPFLKMTDINCLTEREEQTFIYKIYIMLYAYHLYKDNYDCLNKIVDTILKPIDKLCGFKHISVEENKKIIQEILNIKNKCKNGVYELSEYKDLYELLYKFSNMVSSYDISKSEIDLKLSLFKKINGFIIKSEDNNIPLLLNKDQIFDIMKNNSFMMLSEVLLISSSTDRFTYVRDEVNKIENNEVLKKDLVRRIGSLSCLLFDYLDHFGNDVEDSFKKYMSSIFDSDSYYELDKKLDILEEINKYIIDNCDIDYKQFVNLAPEERNKLFNLDNEYIKNLLDKFNGLELKEKRNGHIISYKYLEWKPNHIRKRMFELYKSAYSGTNDFPKEYYNSIVTAYYPTYFHSRKVTENDKATIKDYVYYFDKNIEEISSMQQIKDKENKIHEKNKELKHNNDFMDENSDIYVLVDDGFSYVADKIKRFESNPGLRKSLAVKIEQIDCDLFSYLDSNGVKDSFRKCINSIFDSDTYYEVCKKFEILQEMSSKIREKKKTNYPYRYLTDEAKKELCPNISDYILMKFDDFNNDETYRNGNITLEKSNEQVMDNNKLDSQKPEEIRERMANLYYKAYSGNKYFITEEGTNKIDAYYYVNGNKAICSQDDNLTIEIFLRCLNRNIEEIKFKKENQVEIVEPDNLELPESDFGLSINSNNTDTQENDNSISFPKRLFKRKN